MNNFKKSLLIATVLTTLSWFLVSHGATWTKISGPTSANNTWQKITSNGAQGTWVKLGAAGHTGGGQSFNYTISANTNNFNLRQVAINSGWDQVSPLNATITINSGVVVSSSSTANAAFDTGGSFPNGTSLSLINNGIIRGKGGDGGSSLNRAPATAGGAGGAALRVQHLISITNNGAIQGGGGGGGGGSMTYCTAATNFASERYTGGGGGSGGAGGGLGGAGALTYSNYIAFSSYDRHGGNGSNATDTLAGAAPKTTAPISGGYHGIFDSNGADAGTSARGGLGGVGGEFGQPGTAGEIGSITTTRSRNPIYYGAGAGGAGGAAVQGNSSITWLSTGTRTGSIN